MAKEIETKAGERPAPRLERLPEGATDSIPVVVTDSLDGADPTEAVALPETPTEGTGDVYVILPEGEAANIPVVETEVVDDDPSQGDTSPFTQGEADAIQANAEGLGDFRATDALPDVTGGPTDAIAPGTESFGDRVVTENLNEFTAEFDDEVLTGTVAGAARGSGASVDEEEPVFAAVAEEHTAPHTSSRLGLKVGLPIAAAVLIGLGLFVVSDGGRQFGLDAWLGTATSGDGAASGTPATGGQVAGVDGAGGQTSAADLHAAAREAFREKVLLAIDLGLGGDAK